ncbi:MAG TPA: hypothetical protein PLU64_19165 [Saprospiraceae bacterium]|nr:hypothetical protein [Saprospiraceae bacterium]
MKLLIGVIAALCLSLILLGLLLGVILQQWFREAEKQRNILDQID